MEYSLMQRLAAYAILHHEKSAMSNLCAHMQDYAPALVMDKSDALTALYGLKSELNLDVDDTSIIHLQDKTRVALQKIIKGFDVELTALNVQLERSIRKTHDTLIQRIHTANQTITKNAMQLTSDGSQQ